MLFIRLGISLGESTSDSQCGENVVSGEEGSVVGGGGNVSSKTRLSSVLHDEQGSNRRRRHRTLSRKPTNSELLNEEWIITLH